MKTILITLNLIASILVFPAMWLVHKAQVASAMHMYTELDRAQVIDRERLTEVFPSESSNDRYDIPRKLTARRKSAWMIGYPCIFGFLMNALLIGIFMREKQKAEQAS